MNPNGMNKKYGRSENPRVGIRKIRQKTKNFAAIPQNKYTLITKKLILLFNLHGCCGRGYKKCSEAGCIRFCTCILSSITTTSIEVSRDHII